MKSRKKNYARNCLGQYRKLSVSDMVFAISLYDKGLMTKYSLFRTCGLETDRDLEIMRGKCAKLNLPSLPKLTDEECEKMKIESQKLNCVIHKSLDKKKYKENVLSKIKMLQDYKEKLLSAETIVKNRMCIESKNVRGVVTNARLNIGSEIELVDEEIEEALDEYVVLINKIGETK